MNQQTERSSCDKCYGRKYGGVKGWIVTRWGASACLEQLFGDKSAEKLTYKQRSESSEEANE